jgi:hypothetical protein
MPSRRKIGAAATDPSDCGGGLHAGERSRQLQLGNGGRCSLEEETCGSIGTEWRGDNGTESRRKGAGLEAYEGWGSDVAALIRC